MSFPGYRASRRLASRIRRALRERKWEVLRRRGALVTTSTHHGVLTFSAADDVISRMLYLDRCYEYDSSLRLVEFLRDSGLLPRTGIRMYDIGANIGFIGIGVQRAGLVTSVVAVEPAPENFRLLQRNIDQNGLSNRIVAFPYALADSTGGLTLELSPDNRGDHRVRSQRPRTEHELFEESERKTIAIEALSLAELVSHVEEKFGPAPSFVWIDVQGYEGYVFRGGEKWLEGGIPVYSEVWPYGILRAGMTLDEFTEIVTHLWTHFWLERDREFTQFTIGELRSLLDGLEPMQHLNVLFVREPGDEALQPSSGSPS